MRRCFCLALAIAAAGALAACALANTRPTPAAHSAVERGVEERPPPGAHLTPTAVLTQRPVTPFVIPSDTPEPGPVALSAIGPWVLYCTADGRAALMDPEGRGRVFSGQSCLPPAGVSREAGLAMVDGLLLQFPTATAVRFAPGEALAWSAGLALISNPTVDGDMSALILYDVTADRFRQLLTSGYDIFPKGLSPDGRWAVYLEKDMDLDTPPNRQPPGQLMAISTDGRQRRTFYSVYGIGGLADIIIGWLSESTFLIQHQADDCDGVRQNYELSRGLLDEGEVRPIFGKHSYAAFDPKSQTVLLVELPEVSGVVCSPETTDPGPLAYLSASDGWERHTVTLPADWGERWEVRQIQWHPELDVFSVLVGEVDDGPLSEVLTVTITGQIVHSFPLDGAESMSGANLYPSPNGVWIVLGAAAPFGTRLYYADGFLAKELAVEGGELSQGLSSVLWLPDSQGFLMAPAARPGIFRAAAEDAWNPIPVEPNALPGTDLMWVGPPTRPFTPICGGRHYSRLQLGDRVMVSLEPPLASRLRQDPGPAAAVIGMLEPGKQAEILDGPVCAEPYVWWYLQSLNLTERGWAAEGDAEGAWLVPLGTSGGSGPSTP